MDDFAGYLCEEGKGMILFFLGCPHEEVPTDGMKQAYYQITTKIHILNERPVSIVDPDDLTKEIFWKVSLLSNAQRKDGSWIYDMHLQCFEEDTSTLSMTETEGVWMKIRAFPHGEFLSQTGYEQSFGEPCYGEHLDVLFFLLFPNVPPIPKKENVYRNRNIKSPIPTLEHTFDSTWRIIDYHRKKQIFDIGYEGKWSTSGQWWEYSIVGEGILERKMEFVLDAGIPQNNQLSLNREICYQKDDTTYCQEQNILYSLSYVQ